MKIIINRCFGGFGISEFGYEEYAKAIGKTITKYTYNYDKKGYEKSTKNYAISYFTKDYGDFVKAKDVNTADRLYLSGNYRTDSILIELVEKYGSKMNDDYADLKVVEIPDNIEWEIDEYDGVESIEEVHRSWY